MSENKIKIGDSMSIPVSGYLFTQTGMLLAQYGFNLDMPKWVVWFPSIIAGGIIGVGISILLIWLIITIISAWWQGR